ncbi:MAG: response regulator, partial [Bacteroidales bacterium]|nr:response regulator [Bacteroidales bacterium]
ISVHLQKQKMEKLETQTKQFEQQVISKNIELKNTRDTLGTVQKEKKEIQFQNEILNKENKIKELMLAEEQARAEAEKREQILIISVLGVFLIGLCVIVILVMRQMNQKKKANNLLKQINKKIEQQKVEIEHQRDVAKVQAKRITDSIQYAQRIQRAVIPPDSLLEECFDEYFIYYKPRDIVSGDFYWFSKKEHLLIVAAADCTGHGVPGAFMSMLGIAFLNEIVNKMAVNKHINSLTSHNILNELRKTVISSLHQTGNSNEPKDGMDISLCVFNLEEDTVQYSGANNPLLIIRNGELIKYKADKMPVSYHQKLKVPFTSTTISLEKNDCIYMFSDGYIDQFGGMRGNKFLIKRFRELLLKNFGLSMNKQKEALVENMDDWMHNTTQLDDMLVLGLRYNPDKYKSDSGKNWHDKTILIAEDKDVNYFLLAEVLKDTKANLVRVKDGAEAVEYVKNNLVDLVLMDINMPNMSGFEATKLIKEFKRDISIIIQTAMHDGNEREESKKAGADDFISKPIDLKSFMNIIEKYLN